MIVQNQFTHRTKPCGCSAGCNCTCNSAVCEPTCDTGISRPNFFAGQLLTDDDLRAALNYVIEKNRLHNRHFMGDGVVCGLEVKHHPCPDTQRKVIVKPGHALDCCGNDIVVQCEEELDILKMVRDLRTNLRGGYDCGDPCAEKQKLFSVSFGPETDLDSRRISEPLRQAFIDNRHTLPVTAPVVVLVTGREWRIDGVFQYRIRKETSSLNIYRSEDDAKSVYNLHIRYAETGFDLVTPYQVDEDCNAGCKSSRIRESFQFELSCDEPPPEVDLRQRLNDCNNAVPDYDKKQAETLHGSRVLETAEQVLIQFEEIKGLLTTPSPNSNRDELYSAIDKITAPAPPAGAAPTVEEQVRAATAIHRFLTLALRAVFQDILQFLPGPIKTHITNLLPGIKVLLNQLPSVDPSKTSIEFPFPVEASVIELLKSRVAVLEAALANGVSGTTFEEKSQFVGELVTLEVVNDSIRRLDKIDEQLKLFVRAGTVVVDRELRQLMDTVKLRLFFDMTDHLKTPELLQVVKGQVAVVSRAVAEISKKCLCEIVLPPCPPCDDPRVLIASVTIENCDVTDICNVKRKMVLTGPSLNYWFASFGIPDKIRGSCCPSPNDIARAKLDEIERLRRQRETWRSAVTPVDSKQRPFAPNLIERVNNPDQWARLKGSGIDKLAQSAIEPAGFDLARELRDGEVPSPQLINVALSKLAGRPATDIRGILDRTGDSKPVAQLERELRDRIEAVEGDLESQIGNAINTSSQANSTAIAADGKATAADAKATAADAKAVAADAKAAAAEAKAVVADNKAVAADAKATAADAKAVAADAKAAAAEAKAVVADNKAVAADAKADEAKADARFDFDNVGTEKNIQQVVTQLRAKAAAGELNTILQIRATVDAIIGT